MTQTTRVWTEGGFTFWQHTDGTVSVDDSEGNEVARYDREDDWRDAVSTFFLSLEGLS